MGDIYRAMAVEAAYIDSRVEGLSTAPLSELIARCGYETLESYLDEKRKAQIKEQVFTLYGGDMTTIPASIQHAVAAREPSVFWPCCSNDFVWHGTDVLDYDECSKQNIDVLEMGYAGGTIVSGPEDFSFGVLLPESIDVNAGYFLGRLSELFLSYGLNSTTSGNDILIDGRKVVGSMSFRTDGLFFFGCQISYVDHTAQIQQLCHKQSAKAPGYVDPMKLPKETLKREVMAWLQKQDQ